MWTWGLNGGCCMGRTWRVSEGLAATTTATAQQGRPPPGSLPAGRPADGDQHLAESWKSPVGPSLQPIDTWHTSYFRVLTFTFHLLTTFIFLLLFFSSLTTIPVSPIIVLSLKATSASSRHRLPLPPLSQ